MTENTSNKDTTIVKCYCSSCDTITKHQSLFSIKEQSDIDDYWWNCTYHIVKCLGCDKISFYSVTNEESSIGYDDEGNEVIIPEEITYPVQSGRVKALSSWYIPGEIEGIYREAISAMNGKNLRLAAAGFRAVIEAICLHESVSGKTLEQKINALRKQGIITQQDRDRLHAIRFMGNDSIHEMKRPEKSQLIIVLDIVNVMLNNLYILEAEFKDSLERPIKTFKEFLKLLDEGIETRSIGQTDILKNLLPPSRRLIKEDVPRFEVELITAITNGDYTKLSLCPSPTAGRHQQYKIESKP